MNKTATFSNGHTDTYKGTRDVEAAWMVIETDSGRVVASGHSLDRAKAAKTAAGNIPRAAYLPTGWRNYKNTTHMHRFVREKGYKNPAAYEADVKRRNAETAKLYSVEVIDL